MTEEEFKLVEKKRIEVEKVKDQIRNDNQSILQMEWLAHTLPLMSDSKALDAAGRVLEMVKSKLNQERELHMFVEQWSGDSERLVQLVGALQSSYERLAESIRDLNELARQEFKDRTAMRARENETLNLLDTYLKNWM